MAPVKCAFAIAAAATAMTPMVAACDTFDPDPLPPFGEVLMVVDTDLPVPRAASRLRIDLQDADTNAIFGARDDVRPDPRDWPTSFSVFTDDLARGRTVIVRLRAYLEGRLSADGTEPDPTIAIDRLVRIRLEPGRRGRVRVTLRGACAGVAANMVDRQSCIEGPDALPIEDGAFEDTLSRSDIKSQVGQYGLEPCVSSSPSADRICVSGGAFVFGDRFYRPSSDSVLPARPERVVRVARLLVDRDEVSVARYRDTITRGFKAQIAPKVLERDGPPGSKVDDACTFSASPRDRENYAISCVPWVTADAFCKFENGSLPTEAQWEHIALAAERPRKVEYPWGDEPPSCDRAIYARSFLSTECLTRGEGLQLPGAAPLDVTPLGIRDLGGGLEEHVIDSVALFDEPCWVSAPPNDPACVKPIAKECSKDPASLDCRLAGAFDHITRGGNWATFPDRMRGISRGAIQAAAQSELVGFRCVYPAP